MRRIDLDTRELEYPKPLERAIEALQNIESNSYLYMRNRKNPIPFISLAKQHGFHTLTHEAAENEWHILVSQDNTISLEGYLDA